MPKKKNPILRRKLTAKTMKNIAGLAHNKMVKPLNRKDKQKGVQRMRRLGQYLLRRKFRSSPEEKIFVEILFKKIKESKTKKPFEIKAELMVGYLKKAKKIERSQAIDKAITLLESITKKVEKKYVKAYRRTAMETMRKKFIAGEEHMFTPDTVYGIAEIVILALKKMKTS